MVEINKIINDKYDNMWNMVDNQDDRIFIKTPDAKGILARGIKHFVGENAVWLDEYEQVAEWLEDNKGLGLFCAGTVGRGKSIICQKVLPVIFEYWHRKIMNTVTATDLNDRFEEFSQYKIISIDDIGVEPDASRYGEKHNYIKEIIDLAERKQKLLVITTNLPVDEITIRYGVRSVDRLRAITKYVSFAGDSLRGRKVE